MVFSRISEYFLAMQGIASLEEKNLPANAGDTRDMGSIPGSEKYPREEEMAIHSSILA